MKTLLIIPLIILISGCDDSSNYYKGKPLYQKMKEQTTVCDDRGYAYYEYISGYKYSLTPILDNSFGRIQQKLCKDL